MKNLSQAFLLLILSIGSADAALVTNTYESTYSGIKFNWSVTFDDSSLSRSIYSSYSGAVERVIDASCPDGSYCGRFSVLSDATFDFSMLGEIVGSTINWTSGSSFSAYVGRTESEGTFVGIDSSELYFYMEPEVYGSSTFGWVKTTDGYSVDFSGSSALVSTSFVDVPEPHSLGVLVLAVLVLLTALRVPGRVPFKINLLSSPAQNYL